MVQLHFLSGKDRGNNAVFTRFPATIGRSPQADVIVEESGVWDQHAEISLDPSRGFVLAAFPNALVSVNGQPTDQAVLRSGDVIELGLLRMEFWFQEVEQRRFRFREWVTWIALGLITLAEVALIYFLPT